MRWQTFIFAAALLCLLLPGSAAGVDMREDGDRVTFREGYADLRLGRAGWVDMRAFDALGRQAGGLRQEMAAGAHELRLPWASSGRLLWVRIRTPLGTATVRTFPGARSNVRIGAARIGEMRLVPSGRYEIGSPVGESGRYEDEILHAVVLSPFWIDTIEVLREDFRTLMGGVALDDSCIGRCPATGVNWFEALLYCNARSREVGRDTAYLYSGLERDSLGRVAGMTGIVLRGEADGYRLPTEAQWEVAARAGSAVAWFWGSDTAVASDFAWFAGNAQGAMPAATRRSNGWGLYDMAGNVWEWVEDWYATYGEDGAVDPVDDTAGIYRGLRGGCWKDSLGLLRSAYRNGASPGYRSPAVGFRCVRPER